MKDLQDCDYQDHYCNGQHVPDVFHGKDNSKVRDRKPCLYFKNNRCTHILNPKYKAQEVK